MTKANLFKILGLFLVVIIVAVALFYFVVIKRSGGGTTFKPVAQAPTFTGEVRRIFPNGSNIVIDVQIVSMPKPEDRITKSFVIPLASNNGFSSLIGSSSAQQRSFQTSFGSIEDGDLVIVGYSGNKSPYTVTELTNSSIQTNNRQPGFVHGFVTSVSGITLKMISSEGNNYVLEIQGSCLLGQKYQIVEEGASKVEKPGVLKATATFSELKVGDQISVFYTENNGEVIVPETLMII